MGSSATTTAAALGTGIETLMGTLTTVSLDFMTQQTLITAVVIASFIFMFLYWLKRKI